MPRNKLFATVLVLSAAAASVAAGAMIGGIASPASAETVQVSTVGYQSTIVTPEPEPSQDPGFLGNATDGAGPNVQGLGPFLNTIELTNDELKAVIVKMYGWQEQTMDELYDTRVELFDAQSEIIRQKIYRIITVILLINIAALAYRWFVKDPSPEFD